MQETKLLEKYLVKGVWALTRSEVAALNTAMQAAHRGENYQPILDTLNAHRGEHDGFHTVMATIKLQTKSFRPLDELTQAELGAIAFDKSSAPARPPASPPADLQDKTQHELFQMGFVEKAASSPAPDQDLDVQDLTQEELAAIAFGG